MERIAGQWGLRAELNVQEGTDEMASDRLRREVYYIVREAVFNAARHGRGSEIKVRIVSDGLIVSICVTDNGQGFSFRGQYDLRELDATNSGPVMLRQRVKSLGGSMVIASGNPGSSISISLPISL